MTDCAEFGYIVKIVDECVHIEWRIPDFLSTLDNTHRSPTFFVLDDPWSLKFRINIFRRIAFRLECKIPRKYSIEYTFAIPRSDSPELGQFGSGIINEGQAQSKWHSLLIINLFSGGIIRCVLRPKMTHSTQPIVLDKTKPLRLISLDRLSENFKDLFDDKETCDTTLKVKDKEYKAHRAILIARSPVFAAMFKHDTFEKQTGIINITDCDSVSFQQFLEFLYCGKFETTTLNSIFHLYVTSDKYEVQELKHFCIEYLEQCLTEKNFCKIAVFADKYDETKLFSAVQRFFNQNLQVLETIEWEWLMKMDYRLANKLLKEMAKEKRRN